MPRAIERGRLAEAVESFAGLPGVPNATVQVFTTPEGPPANVGNRKVSAVGHKAATVTEYALDRLQVLVNCRLSSGSSRTGGSGDIGRCEDVASAIPAQSGSMPHIWRSLRSMLYRGVGIKYIVGSAIHKADVW
ncbi:uncharacterized protein MYCGRDRAFT_90328 [Zymoseptoria tritici IPO323]|uniref:Uncharacterized protein n=1 Tax=Zymoseptoria tritici (strain CBS 115943 / IPO323) TaxID=336722 RepID=F9X1X6_ZYMTI|nr:uncharacterized protein MYCGRDRAFT_90328 [Zymoseptoria tritici IPO323]EGP90796.1 hypothetical protein MYCGRDRAFT_90328 [Zymoseptoria tritici IPO323]